MELLARKQDGRSPPPTRSQWPWRALRPRLRYRTSGNEWFQTVGCVRTLHTALLVLRPYENIGSVFASRGLLRQDVIGQYNAGKVLKATAGVLRDATTSRFGTTNFDMLFIAP